MEITGLTRRVDVRERTDAGEMYRQATLAAERARLDEASTARLAVIARELTTNLLKHTARGGQMLINAQTPPAGPGAVELLAIDRGPGMTNAASALRDRYSTGGTLGIGLGAVQRQSNEFAIHSSPERGTAILARVFGDQAQRGDSPYEVGVVTVPKDGEEVSGDNWAVCALPDGFQLVVVDGLGHGLLASEAAGAAVRAFRQSAGRSPVDVLHALHRPLMGTRGATAGVATIDTSGGHVTYGGIGNIAAAVFGPTGMRRLVSLNGTVGREPVSYRQFEAEWEPDSILIMHSDGLMTQWRLDYLPGLVTKDPSLIAAALFRDFARDFDDVTVVVAKQGSGSPQV
ncbi:MAG TPA: SpoIIE family protein phosphatase [Candidatus Dormibacteraeota bacterium]|nr:SpoIIE family protein phosphatase [Candidatus Dormibacteraeota bacterium]